MNTWLPVICCRSQDSAKMGLALLSLACKLMLTVNCLWATRRFIVSALAWVRGFWVFPFLWLTSRTAETPVLPSTMGKHRSTVTLTKCTLCYQHTAVKGGFHVDRAQTDGLKFLICIAQLQRQMILCVLSPPLNMFLIIHCSQPSYSLKP